VRVRGPRQRRHHARRRISDANEVGLLRSSFVFS
jgi:hypothetical protein